MVHDQCGGTTTLQVAKKLRSLPVLDVSLPTLALVGAPNVGKSSLVKVGWLGTDHARFTYAQRSCDA
jgi:nucleolar GTP-binding protein